MNKKLLAAAIAATVAAPMAATAANDVTVYGKAHVMMINNDLDLAGTANDVDNWELSSTNSRLGFKGSEDLGNGLKAIWKYETTVNITDGGAGGGTFGSARNAYLGLSGGFGSVLAGRHDSPSKVAFYATGNDHLDGSIVDLNGLGHAQASLSGNAGAGGRGSVFVDERYDNVLAYISPSFSGLTVAAAVMPGEASGATPGANDGFADHYSLGVMYANACLKVGAGYESLSDGTNAVGSDDDDHWHIGGSYTFGMFTVGGNYQDRENDNFVKGNDTKSWALTGKATFGNNAVILQYTDVTYETTGAPDLDADEIGIAFQHMFSKRTSAYVAYNKAEIDATGAADPDSTQYGVGMIHTF